MKRRHYVLGALPALLIASCGPNGAGGCAPPPPAPAPIEVEQPAVGEPAHVEESVVIGYSHQGREIVADRIGNGPRKVAVVSQIHGNEKAPLVVADVAAEFAWDGSTTVWVIRTLNPDGVAFGDRRNAAGKDLNRYNESQGQPEAEALRHFIANYGIELTVHVHSPNGWIGYYGGMLSRGIAQEAAQRLGMPFQGNIANHYFLWMAHDGQTVIFEVPAIDGGDAPGGQPRAQTNADDVHWRASILFETVDAWL